MGEYLTDHNGNTLAKAGTMDDFRYVRRSELEYWSPKDGGHNTNCQEVLKDPSTLYRFPFPWEDEREGVEINFEQVNNRDMDKTLTFYDWKIPEAVIHKEIVQHIKGQNMGTGINVWLPCPAVTPNYPVKTSNNPVVPAINIVGERYDQQGNGRTIFACGWCGALFSLDQLDLLNLMDHLTYQPKPQSWLPDLIKRLKPAGSKPALISV